MIIHIGVTVCALLLAYASSVSAQYKVKPVRPAPTNNIAAARSKYPLSDFDRIATNTPAFEAYGLEFMLTKANEMREKWQIDIPKSLTVNHVLFQLKATAYGIDGAIGTRDKRFEWEFTRHHLSRFRDCRYSPLTSYSLDFEADLQKRRKLAKITSKITVHQAEMIAREALHKLGLSEDRLHLKEPPLVEQNTFEEADGTLLLLPRFRVEWRSKDDPEPEGDEFDYRAVRMEISGITEGVVYYSNLSSHLPRDPLPTNYFHMLGLPENYLDTLPERTRLRWGLPALTNSTAPAEKPN
jgi:hypothetical protein